MTTKKKSKTGHDTDAPPDPREPLVPNAENFEAVLKQLKAVLAGLPVPAPSTAAAGEPAGSAPAGSAPTAGTPAAGAAAAKAPAAGSPAAKAAAAGASTTGASATPQLDLIDALLHFYFADGLPCGYGQEVRRRIADSYVDRNEFRVTEAFEVEDMLRDLPIPGLFDRCLAVRDSIAQIYNDQNGVQMTFLREAGISDRNTFFQRVPAVQPQVATFLTNLLTIEELCFSDKSTLRAQQRLNIDPGVAGKYLDELRALVKPYGYLPLDVGPNLGSKKVNLTHSLSPACLLVRLAPPGKKRSH